MNVNQIIDNLLCSGCGTCNTVCGRNAITMKKTPTMGLLHAVIDSAKCIDCGLCLKMCPSSDVLEKKADVTEEKIIGDIKACYVGRSLDKEIFANAQSGGMVTTILKYLFEKGLIDCAVACRMDYGNPTPSVHYSILTSTEELGQNQKSCYTQVDIVSALRETALYKSIAVVGVPCHMQGVSNLMALKKYSNIKYRIGLICDKNYSDTYMDAIMYGEKVPSGNIRIVYKKKNFNHAGKFYTYQQAPIAIINKQGDMTIIPNSKRIFLKDYFAVPKCKICWDKLNTQADIVLGDPWGLKGRYDEQEGDSVIIIRTTVGSNLVEDLIANHVVIKKEVPLNEVTRGQLIRERVTDLKTFNYDISTSKWKKSEGYNKSQYLNLVARQYRLFLFKSFIARVLRILKP